ncbi:RNA-binding (RRM/RBD/RNP motifs) family protein [Actinidia rufa]|uniref:RNA-binding (RRM/RBD/RNP motifs) family protein n=1 Tax=Actinidia rufa TaxID=165716 RepID=A0A7J0GG53_9ERIC|nr:RNA-binding (RRM/RBD/RNP motifs) family protein [Actinidia rufa]
MTAAPPSQSSLNPQTAPFIGYQGAAKVSSETSEKWAETLLIRHLLEAIPHDALSRLFSHYGASSVRPCANGRGSGTDGGDGVVRNCAFVDFRSEALATQAHRQLNGLCFLGKVLAVERASKPTENNKHQQGAGQPGKHSSSLMKDTAPTRDLNKGSKLGSFPSNEPIAERLDVDYPFPPHLEYAYPPPDGNILTNIVNALIAVPRFYTQVLHLMNKMNIPAPFRMALPTPPLPPSLVVPPPPPPPPPPLPPTAIKPSLADLSSGESELESSDEEVDDKAIGAFRVGRRKRKRIQREAIVGPAVDKYVAHEAVGLKPACLVPKEIPVIKKKNPVLQIKIVPKQIQKELERGKLPPEEILSLPMFKNYTAGNPAPVLYIKNLAKDVVADDFYFIFGSLFGSTDAAKSSLSVKLMQNLANGYVFKSKPMIIQFGRSATIAKANTELL